MNNRVLAAIVSVIVLICIGLGILIFRPVEVFVPQNTASAQEPVLKENILTVSGVGKIKIKPDVAFVQIGVLTQDPNAKKAQEDNKVVMDAVLKAVKGKGLKDEDMQTSRFGIEPQYDYSNDSKLSLLGYNVTNMVTLTIKDVNRVGEILDAAAQAGANQAYNIQFGLQDTDAAYKKALENAITDAKGKADVIAKASNIQLKGPIIISEGGSQTVNPLNIYQESRISTKADMATSISVGEMEVSATVTITYSIK